MHTGERIKLIREYLKLNQKELSELLGISPSFLSEIEKGKKKPSEKVLRLISRTLGVNYKWLKEGKGEIWQKEKKVHAWLEEFLTKAEDLDIEVIVVITGMLKKMSKEDKKFILEFLKKWDKCIEKEK